MSVPSVRCLLLPLRSDRSPDRIDAICGVAGCPCCGKGAKAPAGDPLWGSESEKANRPMEIDLTHRYHPVRRTHMASNPVYKPPRPPGSDEDDLDDVDL